MMRTMWLDATASKSSLGTGSYRRNSETRALILSNGIGQLKRLAQAETDFLSPKIPHQGQQPLRLMCHGLVLMILNPLNSYKLLLEALHLFERGIPESQHTPGMGRQIGWTDPIQGP